MYKTCNRCKKDKLIENFINVKNVECKQCYKCRKRNKKCEHGKMKTYCKECGGTSICEHGKRKVYCKECGGGSLCEHGKRKDYCKVCGDEIKITIEQMIKHSKFNDKKYNRYDQTNFIDKCFVKNLIEDSEDKCYYCKCELQYIDFTSNLATIERLDNKIGHIKGNCVIACKTCNNARVGDK